MVQHIVVFMYFQHPFYNWFIFVFCHKTLTIPIWYFPILPQHSHTFSLDTPSQIYHTFSYPHLCKNSRPSHGIDPPQKRSGGGILQTSHFYPTLSKVAMWKNSIDQHWMDPSEELTGWYNNDWSAIWNSLYKLRKITERTGQILNKCWYKGMWLRWTENNGTLVARMVSEMSLKPQAVGLSHFWTRH